MNRLDELHRRLTASISFPLTNYLFNRRHIARDFKELMRTRSMVVKGIEEEE